MSLPTYRVEAMKYIIRVDDVRATIEKICLLKDVHSLPLAEWRNLLKTDAVLTNS